jgi:hypothetical protein
MDSYELMEKVRETSAKAVTVIAVVAALTAAGAWAYFIWSLDWGHTYRGRGLWFMAMIFPTAIIGPAVFFAVGVALIPLWELIFREKFPL